MGEPLLSTERPAIPHKGNTVEDPDYQKCMWIAADRAGVIL